MIVDADKVKELKNLAVAFALLELPGQPRAMHMGTSYLVNQLMSAVESQAAEIERLKEDARRLDRLDSRADDWTYKNQKAWSFRGAAHLSLREALDAIDAIDSAKDKS